MKIFLVYICYALLTINKRLLIDHIFSPEMANLISYPLLTLTFILTTSYINSIYHNIKFHRIVYFLDIIIIILMISQIIVHFINHNVIFFEIGMGLTSIIYIIIWLLFFIQDFHDLETDSRILMIATNIMIFSFIGIIVLHLLHISQVYYCSLGLFVYITVAEYITIKNLKLTIKLLKEQTIKLSDEIAKHRNTNIINIDNIINSLSEKQKQVYDIISNSNKGPKEICVELNVKPDTARVYIKQIYAKFGVHSREELHNLIQKN